jgi:hypothetical protein
MYWLQQIVRASTSCQHCKSTVCSGPSLSLPFFAGKRGPSTNCRKARLNRYASSANSAYCKPSMISALVPTFHCEVKASQGSAANYIPAALNARAVCLLAMSEAHWVERSSKTKPKGSAGHTSLAVFSFLCNVSSENPFIGYISKVLTRILRIHGKKTSVCPVHTYEPCPLVQMIRE